jgi:hypothetical protein
MADKEVPVIIPSVLPKEKLDSLINLIWKTAGYPHWIIPICGQASAAVNRNKGLDEAGSAEMVVMLDDDVEPINHGWFRILINALSRHNVLMVSAQLYKPGGGYAYMTGLQDWGGLCKESGETVVPTKRLLTACCAFKPLGGRFDEGYIGSGFEDVDISNQLSQRDTNGLFIVCHDAHVIHRNEQREQGGENWTKNKALYESKWGRVETREELRRKFRI